MCEVAGVQQECRRGVERVDLVNGGVQSSQHVGIRWLVETDMAVADLDETQFALEFFLRPLADFAHGKRFEHSALQHKISSCPGPSHAFQKSAAVDPVA